MFFISVAYRFRPKNVEAMYFHTRGSIHQRVHHEIVLSVKSMAANFRILSSSICMSHWRKDDDILLYSLS